MLNQNGFSFKEIIEDGEKALEAKLYRIAFLTALIVPSVCARIEYKDDYFYQDEYGRWRDKDSYIAWCRKYCIMYLDAENKHATVDYSKLDREYYEKLYDIRCAVVHESSAKCEGDMCALCINSEEDVCRTARCDRYNRYDVCLISFCKQMFEIGKEYYEAHKEQFDSEKIVFKDY